MIFIFRLFIFEIHFLTTISIINAANLGKILTNLEKNYNTSKSSNSSDASNIFQINLEEIQLFTTNILTNQKSMLIGLKNYTSAILTRSRKKNIKFLIIKESKNIYYFKIPTLNYKRVPTKLKNINYLKHFGFKYNMKTKQLSHRNDTNNKKLYLLESKTLQKINEILYESANPFFVVMNVINGTKKEFFVYKPFVPTIKSRIILPSFLDNSKNLTIFFEYKQIKLRNLKISIENKTFVYNFSISLKKNGNFTKSLNFNSSKKKLKIKLIYNDFYFESHLLILSTKKIKRRLKEVFYYMTSPIASNYSTDPQCEITVK